MPLDEKSARADPIVQLEHWLGEAVAAGIPNAEAMALATATPAGRPSVRFVLLKGLDERGLAFYTNYESRKGRELERNPEAAAVLYWVDLGRQVRAAGPVERISAEESWEYFRTRPIGSRLGAWASPQSEPIASREALDRLLADAEARFPKGEPPLPPFWGGYRLEPREIEFWEHRDSRLHDRLLYTRTQGGWTRRRLRP